MLPIQDIIVRSLCGYVFILPILAFYFFSLRKSGRKQSILHILAVFLFCYYLFGVFTVTGIGYTSKIHFRPRISLIPFLGMASGPVETMLNIVLFVPLGFFLPLLYKRFHSIKAVITTGFLFSLSVELLQLFDWGTTDINDLITNTAGTCLGFAAYCLLSRILPSNLKSQFRAEKTNGKAEVLVFLLFAVSVMVTVQPWVIHSFLNIG